MSTVPRKTALNGRRVRIPVSHAKTSSDVIDAAPETDDAAAGADDSIAAVPAPVDALSELMTSLQGASTARINVYRIVKNQPPSYVFECAPESFSLDELRDKYNGGEFRLYVMKDGRLWKNTRVIVEPRQIIHNGTDPSPPTQMFDMMALIRDGFSAQTTAMREIAAGRSGSSMFSSMDLPAIITAAAAAITALRPPPAPPPPAAPDTTSQALDMFMKGMQIAMDVRDSTPSGDNSIGGMLRDALRSPVVAAAVQASIAQPQPAPRPAPRPALPPGQPQAQQPPVSHAKTDAAPDQPANPENAVLSYYLGFLSQKAAAGADADLYADFVLDNLSDEQLTPMIARGPLLIDDFIAVSPGVATHREWFEKLIQAVTEAMTPDEEPLDHQPPVPEASDAAYAAPTVVLGNAPQ